MRAYFKEVRVRTSDRYELVDITRYVEEAVRESGIRNGVCVIHAPHATAAIVINEHEAGLMSDIVRAVEKLYPRSAGWKHDLIDDNAAAHIASALIGSSRVIPVRDGRLLRGTWQNVFLMELDGPRYVRRVIIEVLGE